MADFSTVVVTQQTQAVVLSTVQQVVQVNSAVPGSYESVGRLGLNLFNVREYGAVGDGVTDDTAALTAAINAAHLVQGTVYLEPGKNYLLGTKLTVADKHINLMGYGATVTRATALGQDEGLVVSSSFGSIVNVLSLTTTTTTIDAGATPTAVARIELADTSTWSVGDTFKIFSSDRIPYGSRDGSGGTRNELYGEIVQVAKIAAPYLYTSKPLRIYPVNDIRVAKLTPLDCNVTGITFTDPSDAGLRHNHPLVKVVGMIDPVFRDLHFPFVMGAAFQLESCFQPRSYNCRFTYCYADLAQFTYGYGIHEFACTDGRHYGIDAGNVRHAYTTGAHENPNPTSGTDVTLYGGVVGTILYGGACLGSGNSGFDTHEDATDVWFIGCTVTQEYQGNQAAGFCFKLRGKDCGMIGCKSTGAGALDLNAVGEGGGNYIVKSHSHLRPVGYANSTAIMRIRSEWASTPSRMTVELDCNVDRHPSNIVTVDNTIVNLTLNGDVAFNTFDDNNLNGSFSRCGWVSLTNAAEVTLRDGFLRFDRSNQAFVSGVTQQTPYLVQLADATTTVFRSDRLRLQAGNGTQHHLAQGGDAAPVGVGTVLFNRIETDRAPGAASTRGFYNFAGGALRGFVFVDDALTAWLGADTTVRLLAQSAVAIPHTGDTNETTLATITIPADTLGPNGGILVEALFSMTSSVNSKTARIRWGGSAIRSQSVTTSQSLQIRGRLVNRNDVASQVGFTTGGDFGAASGAVFTGTADTSGNVSLTLTGTLANTSETITLESYTVWVLPTP